MNYLLVLVSFSIGCATVTRPYTTETLARTRILDDGSYQKTLTVHNPLQSAVEAKIECQGDVHEGESTKWFKIEPYGSLDWTVKVQDPYRKAPACTVVAWNSVGSL